MYQTHTQIWFKKKLKLFLQFEKGLKSNNEVKNIDCYCELFYVINLNCFY